MSRYEAPDAAINHALGYSGAAEITEACRVAVVAELRAQIDDLEMLAEPYDVFDSVRTGLDMAAGQLRGRGQLLDD